MDKDFVDIVAENIILLPLVVADRLKEKGSAKILRILCFLWFLIWLVPAAVLCFPIAIIGLLIEVIKDI